MAPEKRVETAGGRRIPIPPAAILTEKAQIPAPAKSGIPSPRGRSASGGGTGSVRDKDTTLSAILSAPNAAKQRPFQVPAASKFGKPVSRPASSQSGDDKDDIRQRDNRLRRDSLPRDKALKDSVPRRPAPATEATNLTDAGKRLLLKSPAASCSVQSPNGKPPPAAASSKALPRSVSTCRDRLATEARSNIMQRSMSVGKGRILANQTEQGPQQAGAKSRPAPARASVSGAPYRQATEKRDPSAMRLRPLSAASGKSDASLTSSCKSTLAPITEAPARPAALTSASTGAALPKPVAPPRPIFALNLAAIKQQAAAPASTLPPVEPCQSPTPEDLGPPVPKLDLGGILQRRAEEQATEPVFVVAASNEDPPQPSGSSAQALLADKRKSGSRQASAKEEPAEHFYLYPKVNPQEKKRIEDICRAMPKKQQAAITDLFGKMVEARQNCEQMCFRGHRLLDQAQAEFKNRLAQKDEEVAQKSEEAAQWRQEAEFLRAQLAMLLGTRHQDCVEEDTAPLAQVENPSEGGEEDRAAYIRSNVLSTFDSMAQLGPASAEAFCGER